ncbi:hypothetical protein L873DRAFT_1812035 [Choiromyces venosus 120613-1]|uniref:WSC domain-containing protein n=1 Tax=Choiromyces venosus 120613-1 TaxID=1336337 RepID=A0A3N4JCF9_9PEZI|nr:hypothetical protein L873DRAFT_1812035 [Choiromyces venosus 120613-1]
MKAFILAAAALHPFITSVAAQNDGRYVGCYKSSGSLTSEVTEAFNSRGSCREACIDAGNSTVEAMTKGTACYCGTSLPPADDKVEDSQCSFNCPGFASETCGNSAGDHFSVYLTGMDPSPPVDTANGTLTTAVGGNGTTATATDKLFTIQTSIPANATKSGVKSTATGTTTTTGGSGGSVSTGASTTSSTRAPNAGDSIQVGSGILVGAIMGVLAMVF